MLRTNSKKARENIRAYIITNFDPSNYDLTNAPESWEDIAALILETFRKEKYYSLEYMRVHNISERHAFAEWAAGLPSILDTCYFYNRSAIDDLGAILEETDAEKERFNESDAETLLTNLIYRELTEGAKKHEKVS